MSTVVSAAMGRPVSLALVSPDGRSLGVLPPFQVHLPWVTHVAAVVAGARVA